MNREPVVYSETYTKEDMINMKVGQNRKLNRSIVIKYRTEMNNLYDGKTIDIWRENDRMQSPIAIDKNEVLRAGQHRRQAFIESKLKSIKFPTIRGASEEEIRNQDAGLNRSFNDRVGMFHDNPKFKLFTSSKLTAICRLLVEESDKQKSNPSNVADKIKTNIVSLSKLDSLLTKDGLLRTSAPLLAACVFAYNHMDEDKWKDSVTNLDRGINLIENSPIHRLMKITLNKVETRRTAKLFSKAVGALKATHQNRFPGKLTANDDNFNNW